LGNGVIGRYDSAYPEQTNVDPNTILSKQDRVNAKILEIMKNSGSPFMTTLK